MQGKPNILLIMADQHRADCLGSYGNEEIKTPNLDSLAADGIVFDQCFCSSPLCTPSRYSMLTGLYPHQHLGWDNGSSIPPDMRTFPKELQQHGYRTKVVGKMHLAPTYMDVGFDEMELAEQNGTGRFEDDYHRDLRQENLIDYIDLMDQVDAFRETAPQNYWEAFGAIESNLPEKFHSTAWIGRRAVSEILEWGDEGNFLMASFIKPHHPFDPPHPWSEMYNPDELTLLPGWSESCIDVDLNMHPGFFPHAGLTDKALRRVMSYYYASISHIDFYVGEMIRTLKRRGMYDDTFIIYISDHGEYLGFHHLLLKQNHMYDPLVRVPFIVKTPFETRRGSRNGNLVSNIDLPATILDHLNLGSIRYSPGINALDPSVARNYVFSEELCGKQYMIRNDRRKLILKRDQQEPMLFDLERDPMEFENVYGRPEYQQDARDLTGHLHQLLLFDSPSAPYFTHEPSTTSNCSDSLEETIRWTEEKYISYSPKSD